MFGPAFLVNPITEQLYTEPGATATEKTSKVYLPSATWYNFWNAKKLAGGQTIEAAAPLNSMPLYVKAGSIIPFGPFEEYATEKAADTIELRIYPGANGEFTLYEDENDNYNYEKGQFATIHFTWNDAQKQLTIGSTKGKFAGMLKQRVFNVVMVKEGHGVDMNITTDIDKAVNYTGKEIKILL
jgi:alpha-D-xyloside xylohydrolase